MISALIGSTIMSLVTVAMLVAINITEKAFNEVGRYSLTDEEKSILIDAGYNSSDIDNINQEIKSLNFIQ